MAAGISKVRQLSANNRVKKQLNDLYISLTYKLHQEMGGFGITAVTDSVGVPRPNGVALAASDIGRVTLIATDPTSPTVKDWEANVPVWSATDDVNYSFYGAAVKHITKAWVLTVAAGSFSAVTAGAALRTGASAAVASDTWNSGTATITAGPIAVIATDKIVLDLATGAISKKAAAVPLAATEIQIATITGVATYTAAPATGADVTPIAQAGQPMFAPAGQMALLVVDFPVPGDTAWNGMVVTINAARASDPTNATGQLTFLPYQFKIDRATGIDQALGFVDSADQIVTDLVAIDWTSLAAGTCADPTLVVPAPSAALQAQLTSTTNAVLGGLRGQSFVIMTVPHLRTDYTLHSYIREMSPDIPKDYREVADHFDGAADVIQTTIIPTLTVSKVFETVPGSFKNLRARKVTFRAETKEKKRFDSSETHYFLGVNGTPSIRFQQDNESISNLQATMYRWIYVS